jgi:hypothetical protein
VMTFGAGGDLGEGSFEAVDRIVLSVTEPLQIRRVSHG